MTGTDADGDGDGGPSIATDLTGGKVTVTQTDAGLQVTETDANGVLGETLVIPLVAPPAE